MNDMMQEIYAKFARSFKLQTTSEKREIINNLLLIYNESEADELFAIGFRKQLTEEEKEAIQSLVDVCVFIVEKIKNK